MKELLQSGAITELRNTQNASYVLQDSALFNLTGYKILNGFEKNGLVKCAKVLHNGKIKLLYFTAGNKNFKNMLTTINEEAFVRVVANILKAVIEVQRNGFLNCENLDMSHDKIYVDNNTLSVSLIYLPINNNADIDVASFENDLKTDMLKTITSFPTLATDRVRRISAHLSNGTFSLEDVYRHICKEINGGGIIDENRKKEGAGGRGRNGASAQQPTMLFSSNDPANPLTFKINTPVFVIGKNIEKCNGVISFNNAIGRVHCRFVYQNNRYCIIDGNGVKASTNGTFVNGKRIPPNEPYPVKGGDIIRLANSAFTITM